MLKEKLGELLVIFVFWLVKQLGVLSEYLIAKATESPYKKRRKRKGVKKSSKQSGPQLPNRRVSPLKSGR